MSRKPLKTTRLAVTLQAASLLAMAGGVFAILISDVTRHRTDNLEGTLNMVAMFQKYQDCVDGAQAYAHLVSPPENRNYQPWYVCRKELVNLPNPLVTPPHIVR
jgi:hypothetical protein